MPTLRVVPTGQRKAFDIVADAPDYQVRHTAIAVYVHYLDAVEEARLPTYSNDLKPFGPTLRHYQNISENIINRFHLLEDNDYQCDFIIGADGSHHYVIRPNI